jgi:hypothetical protein
VEGNILLVRGKVRVKGDEVQLVCDQVQQHQLPETEPSIPPRTHRLKVTLNQTEIEQDDLKRLHQILDIIIEYPGQDEVSLAIATEDGVVNLEMPNITANCCSELRHRLLSLVPEEGLTEEYQAHESLSNLTK